MAKTYKYFDGGEEKEITGFPVAEDDEPTEAPDEPSERRSKPAKGKATEPESGTTPTAQKARK